MAFRTTNNINIAEVLPKRNKSYDKYTCNNNNDYFVKTLKNSNSTNKNYFTIKEQSPLMCQGSPNIISDVNDLNNESQLKKLLNKFSKTYEELKAKKQKYDVLMTKNQDLAIKIKQEYIQRNEYNDKYQQEITSLFNMNQDIENYLLQLESKLDLMNEIQAKDEIINALKERIQDLKNEAKSHDTINKLDGAKNYHMQNETHKLEKKIKEMKIKIEGLDRGLFAKEEEIINLKDETNKLQDRDYELSLEIKNLLEEQTTKENGIKENIENFRSELAKKSQIEHQLEEADKNLAKITQELQTRMRRFDVLLISNEVLERKLKDLEGIKEKACNVENVKKENENLWDNFGTSNSPIKTKTMLGLSGSMRTKSSPWLNTTSIKEININRLSLIAELEKLKFKSKTQRNHILGLQKSLDDNGQQIQLQNKEIQSMLDSIKNTNLDIERNHKLTLEAQSIIQTKSLLLQRMENKINKGYEKTLQN